MDQSKKLKFVNNRQLNTWEQPIIELDEVSINKISAGEVIERPAAVVKELIENSLDAGANSVQITFAHGGKSLIKVVDDGWGIKKNQINLAIKSHSTSKIKQNDLENIRTLGFRGEALSSISSVSKFYLSSRARGEAEGIKLTAENGKTKEIKPTSQKSGTTVEVRDLFYSTPARLKFLRTDKVETQAIFDIVKRLALANPEVAFFLQEITTKKNKVFIDLPTEEGSDIYFKRIENLLGTGFSESAIEIKEAYQGYELFGYISLPSNTVASTRHQYFYINGRSVKDKDLFSALKAAYFDFMAKGRHPIAVINLWCDVKLVDVNVHPMKTEVRFKKPSDVRSLIVKGVKNGLLQKGLKQNSNLSAKTLRFFSSKPTKHNSHYESNYGASNYFELNQNKPYQKTFSEEMDLPSARVDEEPNLEIADETELLLGVAKAQLHENYIISQTKAGLVIVDQHAAHERITYEKLKSDFKNRKVESQSLLIPEIIELSGNEHEVILEFSDTMKEVGFNVENFGNSAICVRSIPAIIGCENVKSLIEEILEELIEIGISDTIENRVNAIISRIACHGSVRAGRLLKADEMNELLRQIESTPFSAQCNHGRPTFVQLKLSDIEKLFGRK